MNLKTLLLSCTLLIGINCFSQTVPLNRMQRASGFGFVPMTDDNGVQRYALRDTLFEIPDNSITNEKIRQSVGYSVIGRSTGTTGNVADIVAGTNGVLRRSGTGQLLFSTLVTNNIGDAQVTYQKIQNVAGTSVFGRSAASTGVGGAITASTNNTVLRRTGDALSFGTIDNNYITSLAWSKITSTPTTLSGYGITDGVATSRQVNTQHSLTGGGDLSANRTINLVGDVASPGNSRYYGTNSSGTRGWYELPSGGGGILGAKNASSVGVGAFRQQTGDTLEFRTILGVQSIVETNLVSIIQLSLLNDENAPGNNKFYGTGSSGTKGWQSLPMPSFGRLKLNGTQSLSSTSLVKFTATGLSSLDENEIEAIADSTHFVCNFTGVAEVHFTTTLEASGGNYNGTISFVLYKNSTSQNSQFICGPLDWTGGENRVAAHTDIIEVTSGDIISYRYQLSTSGTVLAKFPVITVKKLK